MLGITMLLSMAVAGQGQQPAGAAGTNYTLREKDNGGGFLLRVGDTLDVKLPVQLGTGFDWRVPDDHPAPLELIGEPVIRPLGPKPGPLVGQTQLKVYHFRAVRPLKDRIILEKARARGKAVETFDVTIEVQDAPAPAPAPNPAGVNPAAAGAGGAHS